MRLFAGHLLSCKPTPSSHETLSVSEKTLVRVLATLKRYEQCVFEIWTLGETRARHVKVISTLLDDLALALALPLTL